MWGTLWPGSFLESSCYSTCFYSSPVTGVGDEQNSSMTWGLQEATEVVVEGLMTPQLGTEEVGL